MEKSLATMETQNTCPQPLSPVGEDSTRHLQEEMLHLRAEIHQHLEEKRKAEAELKGLKAQIEEAGFSSVSHIRYTPTFPQITKYHGWELTSLNPRYQCCPRVVHTTSPRLHVTMCFS